MGALDVLLVPVSPPARQAVQYVIQGGPLDEPHAEVEQVALLTRAQHFRQVVMLDRTRQVGLAVEALDRAGIPGDEGRGQHLDRDRGVRIVDWVSAVDLPHPSATEPTISTAVPASSKAPVGSCCWVMLLG